MGRRLWAGIILASCLLSISAGIYLIFTRAEKAPRYPSYLREISRTEIFPTGKEGIKVIRIYGSIAGGIDQRGLFGITVGSDSIIKRLERAEEDSRVKAIVLRIDSPGGTIAAVQEVYEAILRAREKGKLIVASMGDMAASGGYYIACAADKIIANPGTLTGSIGVIMTFNKFEELYKKIGIETTVIKSGEFKDIGSPYRDMTDEEKDMLRGIIDNTYNQFIQAIVDGRGMDEEKVRELADGRIFIGEEAKEKGLIDELGGYQEAVQLAADLAGIEPYVLPEEWDLRWLFDMLRMETHYSPLSSLKLEGVTLEYRYAP